jgi:hypothetical protein
MSPEKVEDDAWEHALNSAELIGVDLSSDNFTAMYHTLTERYTHNVEHINYFMTAAMLTVKTLLDTEMVQLVPDEDKLTAHELARKIHILAEILVDSYMWVAAGYELTWMRNEDLPEEITVSFKFNKEDIQE